MPNLFRFLFCCFLFSLFACESAPATLPRTSALDADAGDEPASWEGDWTWEDPTYVEDAGLTIADAGSIEAPQCRGQQLRISVSSGLIADCPEGLVIHAWGKNGEEYLSSPDTTLTLVLDEDWVGWVAFNVTCGPDWTRSVDWRLYLQDSLEERGLFATSSGGHDLTSRVMLCPFARDGSLIPVIPLVCGEDPC